MVCTGSLLGNALALYVWAAAAVIAAAGMIQDAAPTVVASMLVSPLMGPIVGLTFGFISRDQNIMYLSARSELVVW
jgi:uncharacterized membrane protein